MSNNMFGDKHNHYSIRKLSVGAASVLIGATIYLGGVNAQAVRADSINGDATEQVEKKNEADAKTAEVKTTEQKQENNKTAVSATNENAKQNVAENTSDSKKVASNRDVNVIKNDATTDEKAATKSSVQTDKDVNANKLDTNTVSVNKLQRNFNVAGLTESKAASENVEQEAEESPLGARFMNHVNEFQSLSDVTTTRTVTLNKPQSAGGRETITQKLGGFGYPQVTKASNLSTNITTINFEFTVMLTLNGRGMDTGIRDFSTNLVLSNNSWTFASAEDEENYNKFLAFQPSDYKGTLPAIENSEIAVDGYTWKITSATPDGAGLGAETLSPYAGISQNIVIDYTKEEHTVTYKFKDPFGNQVGSSVPVTGAAGSNQPVSLTLPDGYQLASGSLPTSVTIPTNSDKTISIPVKHQLTITISGEGAFNYADDNWKNLVETNELPASGYNVGFNDANARAQLSNGDVTYNENRNVGTYTVSLTEKGLNDIKDQLGDNFIYPDLKDVKSEAKFIIDKGNKTISLIGGDTKVFDNTSTLPDQGTFYSGLGLADNDQGRISVYNSDGTRRTIQLTPADVEFWFNGHKIDKDQAKNVGTYNLRLTDDFINKVKAADGNNGNNYEWAYGTHTPTGSDTYTADYVIYQATGKANLSGNNSKLYDGNAVTTADVNKDGKITIDLTLPVYKKADAPGDEPQLLRTVDLGKYTLQDGDYTWNTADGAAPTKGGQYTIKLNKGNILSYLQDRLVALAGTGTDPDDETKSMSNVTIDTNDMDGQADFDINTTVTYQFVDDDNNKSAVGNPVVVTGLNGKSKDVSLNVPKGYELVGELPTKAAFGDTNKTININLVHKKDVATSQESVTRKITVNNPTTKQADSHDQTVTFTKEVTTDEVTGKSTTIYTPATKSIPEYTAPTFAGYVPNQTTIPATTVKPGDTPDAVIINYNPLVIKINLSGDNMTEFGDDLWQDFYTSDNLIVPGVQNYTLSLSSDQDADIADTHLDLMNGDLIFKEKPTNVGKYSVILSKQGLEDIKSQLKDVLGDLYADSEVQDSNITSDATFTIDKGHKEIDLNGYDSKTFDNTADIPSQDTFYTGLSLSQDSDQPGQISIYDSKDGKLHTITLEPEDVEFWLDGKKISKDQAKNVGSYSLRLTDSFIQKVKDQDGNHGNNYEWTYGTHTPSGDDTYTAEYDINPATGVATLAGSNSKVYDGKAVTTTEVNKDGKIIVDLTLPVYKQTDDEPQLLRTVDLGKYTLQDGDYTWASGAAPTKGGTYTINLNKDKILAHLQDQFNTLAGMGRDFDDPTKSLSNVTIATKDMKGTAKFDINTTVTYQFVDDDNNKSNVGDPEVVTGLNGNSQTVSLVVPDNYVLAAGQTLPTSAKFGDTNTTVDIHLKHDHITVTPDKPGTPGQPIDPSNPDGPKYPAGTDKDSLQSTVKRTINYIYQNGKQAESPVNDSLQFTDTKVIDKVTGEVISDEWSPAQNFNIITTPTIEGYTADQPSISNTNISHDHSAIVETVTYAPNDQTGKISYVDDKTNTEVGTTSLTGKTDEDVTITPVVPTGWKIVDGQNIPKTEKATPNGIDTVIVKVEHKTTTVPPTDPKTPEDKLPDNPDKHYPDGVSEKDLNKTIVRQITVVRPDGTRESHDQSVKLTRSATVDEVTGTVTGYSNWTTGNFDEYDAPVIAGYTPSQAKVDGVKVTADSNFDPVVITYVEDPIGQDITVKKGDTPSPEDGVKNHGDLDKVTDPKHPDAKTTYTWKKTPDTSVAGDVPATVIVHYPDGSNKPVDITVHVIDETPIPTKDPDPIGQDITVKKGDTPDPEDGVKNHGDLDKITDPKHPGTKTTYTWKKTPDTSVAGDVPATVIVHYPDGSNKPVDITVHVIDETPIPTKDPDPIGQDITVKKGDTPDPEDGVKNHGDLDKITDPKHPGTKTTYTWKKTPDTSVAGDVPATVVVHYPDGSEKAVDITVHVVDNTPVVPTKNPEPTGQDIHTPQGKVPTPESAITNKDKMPDGTKYTWKEIPDVNTLGKHPSVVVVTYPDGTAVEVKVNVFVDGTPEAKKETKAPVVKKQVVEPTKVETRQKLVNNYVAPRAVEVQRAQAKGKRQLPQTGAKENIASEVLGMLSVGLGALTAGFASKRRKKNR